MKNQYDIIVAGAGLSGLIAANALIDRGHKVLLLEKSAAPGGRARTRKGAALLNQGAHAVYRKGALALAMEQFGLPVQGGVVSGSGAFYVDGAAVDTLPSSAAGLLTTKLLRKRDLPSMFKTYAALLRGRARGTYGEWLDSLGARKSVREFLLMLARLSTYAALPEEMPAEQIQRQFRKSLGGVYYPHGGWQTLVDGLRIRFERSGGVMRTEEGAARVIAGGSVSVETERGTYTARAAILAMEPARVRRLVPGALLQFEEHPVKAACFDLVVDSLPRPERLIALDLKAPRYLSVHSHWARLSVDKHVVQCLRYLRDGESVSQSEMESWAETVHPGICARAVETQFLPLMAVSQSGADRRLTDQQVAENVFACGDYCGEDMLADAAAESGLAAALLASSRRSIAA